MRRILTLILATMLAGQVLAKDNYDFSAVCSTGQTLYYKIISDVEPYTVAVTYPNKTQNVIKLYKGYTEPTGDLVIPEMVTHNGKTYSVTCIGEDAFSCCENLTTVTIPNSVDSIGKFAFYTCDGLKSITIPNSVTTICYRAFFDCDGLETVNLGNSVEKIGEQAFGYCKALTAVSIPESVKYIGCSAFGYWDVYPKYLQNVEFASVESICSINYEDWDANPLFFAQNLYVNGEPIVDLIIPETVQSINNYAFYYCTSIKSVTIPNTVKTIGESVFARCTELKNINMPNSIESIGESSFAGCSNLKSITIPHSVSSIAEYAFGECDSLTEINVASENKNYTSDNGILFNKDKTILIACPAGKMGDYTIPNSVKKIEQSAFRGCNMSKVSISHSVTEIGTSAFYSDSLYSITIPNSVEKINDGAFIGKNLVVYCEVSSKPKGWHRKWNKEWFSGRTPVVWGKL